MQSGAVRLAARNADADKALSRQRLSEQECDGAVIRDVHHIACRPAPELIGEGFHCILDQLDVAGRRNDGPHNFHVQQARSRQAVMTRYDSDGDGRGIR